MKSRLRLVLLLVFSLAASLVVADRGNDILEKFRKEQWKEAYAIAKEVAKDPSATGRELGLSGYVAYRAGDTKLATELAHPKASRSATAWEQLLGAMVAQLGNDNGAAEKLAKSAARDPEVKNDANAFLLGIYQTSARYQDSARIANEIFAAKPTGYPFDRLMPQLEGLPKVYGLIKKTPKVASGKKVDMTLPLSAVMPYILINASVNGNPEGKFILDTGGSIHPSLAPIAAKELKVDTIASTSAFGFGGLEKIDVGKIDSLKIGDVTIGPQPVAMIGMLDTLKQFMKVDGVLDTRWLLAYAAQVDIEHKSLHVTETRPFTLKAGKSQTLDNGDVLVAQPFTLIGDSKVILPIKINGEDCWAMFDTGAPIHMFSFDWIKETVPAAEYKIGRSMAGGVGNTAKAPKSIRSQRPLTLTLAGHDITIDRPEGQDSLDDQVSAGIGLQFRALLGMALFKNARSFTIDGPARTLYIVYKSAEAAK